MLENRHTISQTVRRGVSPKSNEWGYQLGSVYIRKVHFRDLGMIRQIEEKVVNRLRQVTSAIKQDVANQVSIIKSTAERGAAGMRPQIVGAALQRISTDPEVFSAMFYILETQKISEGEARITLVPGRRAISSRNSSPRNQRSPEPGPATAKKPAARDSTSGIAR